MGSLEDFINFLGEKGVCPYLLFISVTQYFVATDDVHLSSIIQSIQAMIVEEEPYFERRKACKKG
jgi:hypothetical protein